MERVAENAPRCYCSNIRFVVDTTGLAERWTTIARYGNHVLNAYNPRRLMDRLWHKDGLKKTFMETNDSTVPESDMVQFTKLFRTDAETVLHARFHGWNPDRIC